MQNYYRDWINNEDNDDASEGKPFRYKTKIIGKTNVRPPKPPKTPEGGN